MHNIVLNHSWDLQAENANDLKLVSSGSSHHWFFNKIIPSSAMVVLLTGLGLTTGRKIWKREGQPLV
jgi:hypothetical protein